MKNKFFQITLLLKLIFFASQNFATTNYVSKTGTHVSPFVSWAKAATNIQAAVDVASSGDIVLVNDGTYYPENQITVTNDTIVKSVNGAEKTIVDGGFPAQTNRCFYLNKKVMISGFTITNGYLSEIDEEGGGIYALRNATITDCNIVFNKAYSGGGIYLSSYNLVSNCFISGNYAFSQGGGIANYKDAVITDCKIVNNSFPYIGGGVSSDEGGTIIKRCFISGNSCHHASAEDYSLGGGVGGYNGKTTVENCYIISNSADRGGGIAATENLDAFNCYISGNTALETGGGIYIYEDSNIRNCTVVNNTSLGYCGGITAWEASYVNNSIIYYNSAPRCNNVLLNPDYYYRNCCTFPLPEGGVNTITNEPKLAGIYNPHLLSNSPCINAGNNFYATGSDIDNQSRIVNGTVDIGCDEVLDFSGDLSVSILANTTNTLINTPVKFKANINGIPSYFVWETFASTNIIELNHSWSVTGFFTVVLTAYNDTFPNGISATNYITISEAFTNYVSLSGNHISPFTSWKNAATNIQAAIDACVLGGACLVTDGVYNSGSSLHFDIDADGDLTNRIYLNNEIQLTSVNGYKSTIVMGDSNSWNTYDYDMRGVTVNKNSKLSGFTFKYFNARAGGAACINGGDIYDCYFVSNYNPLLIKTGGSLNNSFVCNNDSYNWGVVDIEDSSMNSCLVSHNASDDGSAVYLNHSRLFNCTIVSNSSSGVYIGIDWYYNSPSDVKNCISYYNKFGDIFSDDDDVECDYCCANAVMKGTGNFTNNPEFIAAAQGDYRLESFSPCIDTGTNMSWMWTATDLDGNPRIIGGIVDMGAYEFVPEPVTIYYLPFIIYYLLTTGRKR